MAILPYILVRLTAILGKNEYMEEKIANLRAILNKIDNAEWGAAFGEFSVQNDIAML